MIFNLLFSESFNLSIIWNYQYLKSLKRIFNVNDNKTLKKIISQLLWVRSPFELILFQQINKLSKVYFKMNRSPIPFILQQIGQLLHCLKALILSQLSASDRGYERNLLRLNVTCHLSKSVQIDHSLMFLKLCWRWKHNVLRIVAKWWNLLPTEWIHQHLLLAPLRVLVHWMEWTWTAIS